MANEIMYPSLSELGWVDSSSTVCDLMMSDFFLAEKSQTYIYPGRVSSLPALLHEYQDDIIGLCTNVQSTLNIYFSRVFKDVVVEVKEVDNVEQSSQAAISIFMTFTDSDGISHNLGRTLEISGTTIQKIITLNNG